MNKPTICPKCNKPYTEPPALSRQDNETYICSACCTIESLEDALKIGLVSEEDAREIMELVKNKKM
jgi:hypothetical protein